MSPEQIIAYARQERYRVVVTEQMVAEAIGRLGEPFTCRDLAAALPRDDRGSAASEYLVTLWIENFIERRLVRWTGAVSPRIYESLSEADRVLEDQHDADRMHCGELSDDLGVDVEWCSVCGALRVNGRCGDRWIEPKRVRDGR